MRIELDRATDTAYLAITGTAPVEESVELLDWLIADLDADGRLVGLEILGASGHLRLGEVRSVVELAGTREAAAIFGVRPSNFVRDWSRRPGFPPPIAQLASTRIWDTQALLAYRDAYREGADAVRGSADAVRRPASGSAQDSDRADRVGLPSSRRGTSKRDRARQDHPDELPT